MQERKSQVFTANSVRLGSARG